MPAINQNVNSARTAVHVTATLAETGERRTLYRCGNYLQAIKYAMDHVAHDSRVFDRIEVRDGWGATIVHVVWLSSRMIRRRPRCFWGRLRM